MRSSVFVPETASTSTGSIHSTGVGSRTKAYFGSYVDATSTYKQRPVITRYTTSYTGGWTQAVANARYTRAHGTAVGDLRLATLRGKVFIQVTSTAIVESTPPCAIAVMESSPSSASLHVP